jgi:hypothetical protein
LVIEPPLKTADGCQKLILNTPLHAENIGTSTQRTLLEPPSGWTLSAAATRSRRLHAKVAAIQIPKAP